jgi:hypothetical protein
MSKHEEFEELCALAATGQLSHEQDQRLAEHLDQCEICRTMCDEFSSILRDMPAPERGIVDRDVVRRIEQSRFRDRFLARARAEGRRFSEDAERSPAQKSWSFPRLLPAYQGIAAGVVVAIFASAVGYRALHNRADRPRREVKRSGPVSASSQGHGETDIANQMLKLQQVNEALLRATGELKAENTQLLGRVETLEKELVASEGNEEGLERTLANTSAINTKLASQVDQDTQLLAQTKSELDKADADRTAMEAEVAAAKGQMDELSEQVRLQAVSLDQDKQLLYAGRDITDLMGARNLHIIDVHDADGNGKDRKSFGRVFYTEGKSLIFYAFDLDDKKVVNAKYTFEAWGERLGQPASVKSLGVLYADDKSQRRWVLKVNDPRQLEEMDSVFVTLEPHGGDGEKPRGQKILYAFLGGQANHP